MHEIEKQSIYISSLDAALAQMYTIVLQPYFSILPGIDPEFLLSSIDDHIKDSIIDCWVIDIDYLKSVSLELVKEINTFSTRIPIAVLCTTPDYEATLRLVRLGYYQFVDNPLSVSSLISGIKIVIAEHYKILQRAQMYTLSSLQYKHYKHDQINIITVATGYVDLLQSELENTKLDSYCKKTEQSLQELISLIKKGFEITTPDTPETIEYNLIRTIVGDESHRAL